MSIEQGQLTVGAGTMLCGPEHTHTLPSRHFIGATCAPGIFVDGGALYWWRDGTSLMTLEVSQELGAAVAQPHMVAQLQAGDVHPGDIDFPLAVYHSRPGSLPLVYYQYSARGRAVLAVDLDAHTVRELLLPEPTHPLNHHIVQDMTGDGRVLVMCLHQERGGHLCTWDPQHAPDVMQHLVGEAQAAAPGPGQHGADPSSSTNSFTDILEGDPVHLSHVSGCALDKDGYVRATSTCEGRAAIYVVHTRLPPPHQLAAAAAALRGQCSEPAWSLSQPPTTVIKDWAAQLASGQGADVVVCAAGGAQLRAHSQVLAARWPWFRAQQERWQQQGASTGSGGASSSGRQVDASEHPAAAMSVLLQFLYTGRAQLLQQEQDGSVEGGGEAAGPGPSSTKPASKSGRGKGGGKGKSAAEAAPATAAQAPTGQAADSPTQEQQAAAAELLVAVLHAAAAFELPQLQAACVEAAGRHVSAHSAVPWLVAAHPYSSKGGDDAARGYDPGFEGLKQLALNWVACNWEEVEARAPAAVAALKHLPGEVMYEVMKTHMGRTKAAAARSTGSAQAGRSS